MKTEDTDRFGNLMKVLAETFGAKEPSKELVLIHFLVYSELSIEQFEKGVFELLKTRTFGGTFPVPGEIFRALKKEREDGFL